MPTLETQSPNLQILALGLAAAVAAGITWTVWALRRRPAHHSPASLYETVLTSSEYAVKGRFDE